MFYITLKEDKSNSKTWVIQSEQPPTPLLSK
jgi:hypothetical protein